MSYDSTREVVVSFGGYDGTFLRDTWSWNGASWQQKSSTGPSARADSFMAFDQTDGAMILFGGLAGATVTQDTWRWNGTSWSIRCPPTIPPPAGSTAWRTTPPRTRSSCSAARGHGATVLGDMWVWTGSNVVAADAGDAAARALWQRDRL